MILFPVSVLSWFLIFSFWVIPSSTQDFSPDCKFLVIFRGPFVMPGIKLVTAICKASVLRPITVTLVYSCLDLRYLCLGTHLAVIKSLILGSTPGGVGRLLIPGCEFRAPSCEVCTPVPWYIFLAWPVISFKWKQMV